MMHTARRYSLEEIADVIDTYLQAQRESESSYIGEKAEALLGFLTLLINRNEPQIVVSFTGGELEALKKGAFIE